MTSQEDHEHPHPHEEAPTAEPVGEPNVDALASDWLARELSGVVLAIGQAQGMDPVEWMVGRLAALNQAVARLSAEKMIAEHKVRALEAEFLQTDDIPTVQDDESAS